MRELRLDIGGQSQIDYGPFNANAVERKRAELDKAAGMEDLESLAVLNFVELLKEGESGSFPRA